MKRQRSILLINKKIRNFCNIYSCKSILDADISNRSHSSLLPTIKLVNDLNKSSFLIEKLCTKILDDLLLLFKNALRNLMY